MSKLIKCKSCEKEISKTAKVCPNCGEPSKSSKMMQTAKGLFGLGVLFIVGIPCIIILIVIIGAALQ